MIDISQLIGNTANAALKTLTQSNAASTAAADAKAFQDALSRARDSAPQSTQPVASKSKDSSQTSAPKDDASQNTRQ